MLSYPLFFSFSFITFFSFLSSRDALSVVAQTPIEVLPAMKHSEPFLFKNISFET